MTKRQKLIYGTGILTGLMSVPFLAYLFGRHPQFSAVLPDGSRVEIVPHNEKVRFMLSNQPEAPGSRVLAIRAVSPPDTPHPACYLKFDDKVVEPIESYYDDERHTLFSFRASDLPKFFHNAEIGFAYGEGSADKSLSKSNPAPTQTLFADDPLNEQQTFELPVNIQIAPDELIVRATNGTGEPLISCGSINKSKSREYCFVTPHGQTVANLDVLERPIHWYNLPYKL